MIPEAPSAGLPENPYWYGWRHGIPDGVHDYEDLA
jgi:hypothetical protein